MSPLFSLSCTSQIKFPKLEPSYLADTLSSQGGIATQIATEFPGTGLQPTA